MRGRWRTAFVVLLLGLVGLTGCGGGDGSSPPPPSSVQPSAIQPRSIAVESLPAETFGVEPPPEGATNAVVDAVSRPARLTVTSWGTPGCMSYPVAILWGDRSTLLVTTATSENTRCSAEYLAVSQVVVIPAEHPAPGITAVKIDGLPVPFVVDRER